MTIAATGCTPFVGSDLAGPREARADDESPSSFAGLLAGAMHAAAPKPAPAEPKDGTSELDGPDAKEDAKDEKSSDGSKRSDAAAAATTDPVDGIVRSVAALDAALQSKLARVMERVRNETGHDATVTETVRSQARQDELFAQGRTMPGPVVTWTRASKHTEGRAVDLVLDGGKASPDAYAALQRIAKEEGLRTLGERDPGHLELPTSVDAPPANAASIPASQASITRLAQVAQIARVAGVDRPSAVASVARVASVATVANAHAVRGVAARTEQSSSRTGGGDSGAQNNQRGGYGSLGSSSGFQTMTAAATPTIDPAAAASTASAERADRIMSAIENAAPQALSHISMAVDAGNGSTDRIHVALRGSSLNATIDASDPRAAHAMANRSDELVRALTRDGVDVESVRVRSVTGVAAPTASGSSQGSSDSSTSSRFERGDTWQQQADRQRSQDDRRRNQQRDERGGKTK
jgi:D-alanyl-D-alanine carboxypeptidase.